MSVLKVIGLKKSFGIRDLFLNVDFTVRGGERVGFVGANGAGKTTLMRCLMGTEETDGGRVVFEGTVSVGYVEQQAVFTGETVYDELLTAFDDVRLLEVKKLELEQLIAQGDDGEERLEEYGSVLERFERLSGYDFEARLRKIAFGLGFTEEDFARETKYLSGGQRTRLALAKSLLREPEFLFLDEPTNHLDIEVLEWLEDFLRSYRGGVLLISHDRYFLDRVATKIIELENKSVTVYNGNYTYFVKVKAERTAAQKSAWEKQQEHIKRTEEYIRRFKAGIKAKQARGRQSQLNRLPRLTLPPETAAFSHFAFSPPAECAERVLDLEEVSAIFGSNRVFEKISLGIRRGDGVAIVGPNGAGKTTMLRLIMGEVTSPTGRVKIGNRVQIGYFSQHHEGLNENFTALEEIQDTFRLSEERSRRYLGAFLFQGDNVYKKIGDMSGGEQARLAFLKLMLEGANFLVLDEPTNHLDIPAKEAVEEALLTFPGTFIVVSHDRYFLEKVTNFTVELENGVLTSYEGDYGYYRAKKAQLLKEAAELSEQEESHAKKASDEKKSAREKEDEAKKSEAKKKQATMGKAKREELMSKAEAMIAMLEAELKMLEYEMNDPNLQANPAESERIAAEYAAKESKLASAYEKWELLCEEE